MSDFRVSYRPFVAEDSAFVSSQMQIASVRVVGVDTEDAQAAIFDRLKQTISKFFEFADTQHRLSGRGHSHFRVNVGDDELRYVNNAEQPLITVTINAPSEAQLEVLLEQPETPYPPTGWLRVRSNEYLLPGSGGTTDIYGLKSGKTISVETGTPGVAIFFGKSMTDSQIEQMVRGAYNDKDAADQAVADLAGAEYVFLNPEDGPQFVGLAVGYLSVLVDDDNVQTPGEFLPYLTPQPVYALSVGVVTRLPDPTVYEYEYEDTSRFPTVTVRVTDAFSDTFVTVGMNLVGIAAPRFGGFSSVAASTYRQLIEEKTAAAPAWTTITDETYNFFTASLTVSVTPSRELFRLPQKQMRVPIAFDVAEAPAIFNHAGVQVARTFEPAPGFSNLNGDKPSLVTTLFRVTNFPCGVDKDGEPLGYTLDGQYVYVPTYALGTPLPA